MTAAFEANGAVTRFSYDILGRRMSVSDPLGAAVRFAYSNRGDHIATYDELGGVTRYVYDGEAKMIQVTWPSGRVRSFRWGGYNKLCHIVDEAGGVTRMTYDLDGLPVELINPKGEVHRYERDAHGRLIAEVAFDGVRTSYRRDLAGRLVAVISAAGEMMEFVRDASGKVIERRYADGAIETIEHDERGDLIRAVGPDVEVQFHRDAAGRILREVQIVRGEALVIARGREGYAHVTMTSLGHKIAMTEGPAPFSRRYRLGEAHEVETRSDAYGREVERILPGGGRLESAFDAMGRLAERRVHTRFTAPAVGPGQPAWIGPQHGGCSVRRVHRYSPDGYMATSWDLRHGWTQYEVDARGQLLSASRERGREERYAYDATGNVVRAGNAVSAIEHGNRLVEHGTTHYRYDNVGQLVEKSTIGEDGTRQVHGYIWNPARRLSGVLCPDGMEVQFLYDPLGRRLEKRTFEAAAPGTQRAPRSITRFLWDGAAVIQEIKRSSDELNSPVVEDRRYWLAGDGPVALAHRDVRRDEHGVEVGDWVHYVNDPNGAPTHLVDARGDVVGELSRTGLGRTVTAPGSVVSTAVRFTGQYEDEETGLHYNHFRYYDPDTGRYLSHDPISLRGGHNLYRYVRDPNTMTDPHGLVPCQCVLVTNSGPPERLVGQDANGNNRYAWRRNSGGSPQNVHPDISDHIPGADQLPQGATANPDQRGKCAEPAALTDYRDWLAQQPNPGNATMLNRIQQGVVAVVPMNKGGPSSGSYKAPCDFCGPTLNNMGLSNRVMTPQAAAQSMPDISQVFTIQNVPVFR